MPGRTETFGDPAAALQPWRRLDAIPPLQNRGVILLCTATITEDNLYSNGLFQNVFVFYRMFEAMGYAPIMVVNHQPRSLEGIPGPLRACRTIVMEDVIKQLISNVVMMIEIGMTMDPLVREHVKMNGGRIMKVYLGNILNIDTEIPIFTPGQMFLHHGIGNIDMITVSPHYGQHAEYASCLNHVPPKAELAEMIAPYVWDPSILTRNGAQQISWRPAATPEEEVFVVMDPNISFQKSSIVPLLGLERWYREVGKRAGWKGKVIVYNSERFHFIPHWRENFAPNLELWRDERIQLEDRTDIVTAMRSWPAATFVLHNYNNEYNYMTLELMWAGFPVLHNSPSWAAYGYSYRGADLAGMVGGLERIRGGHRHLLEAYRGHAQALAWRHSPYNPEIQAAWERLLTVPSGTPPSGTLP